MYSKLTSYVKLSPNCNKPRKAPIDRITIHHVGGETSLEALGNLFADPKRQASANYGIDSNGNIACFVEEENRSWCSGSPENDHRAITIEVSNCGGGPWWPVSDAAFESLVKLCADICSRHGFALNFTGNDSGNLTMHRFYANTLCPGPFLAERFPELAQRVNALLTGKEPFYRVQVGAFREKKNAEELQRKLVAQGYGDAFLVEVQP